MPIEEENGGVASKDGEGRGYDGNIIQNSTFIIKLTHFRYTLLFTVNY